MKNIVFPTTKAAIMMGMMLLLLLNAWNFIMFHNVSVMTEFSLINLGSINVPLAITIDKMSVLFSTIVITITMSVLLFSTSYMQKEKNIEYFTILMILFVLSMNILIFIPNLLFLLLGWDGLGLTSYLLVVFYNNSKSISAGMLTALTNRIGDALLIIAVAWALMLGHWNMSFSSFNLNMLISMMIILAAMTKSAQMPFSAWLPAAMAAPTPVSALVHSSTLVTAGVYLIIRFFPTLSEFYMLKFMCFYLGTMTCMMASMAAMVENDLKKIIALSTLSQLGIMMIALGIEQPILAFFHLITHALFKALLFICAGDIIHSEMNNQDIRLMGNLSETSPVNSMMLNTANLSLCGLPFMAGFYSKDSIVETFFMTSMPMSTSLLMMASICLTAAYTMRVSILTLWSPMKNLNFSQSKSKFTYLSYLILLMGAITGGALMDKIMLISNPPSLPMFLKLLTLMLIIAIATYSYINMNIFYKKMNVFMTSMWFMTYLSASPINNLTLKLSKQMLYIEATWMEKLSGKGSFNTLSKMSKSTQKINQLNLSEMMTYFSMLLLFIILIK
uniref:NADH-ubiquinone oxidoreductase chain 5 n=1 Tax=Watersipora subtorquata TaxID=193294 RepID=C4MEF4_9BILA|nr:NADH dehydrogenase subunit 5 [Watersipora subtorquata]ABY55222.1 NADH dehydrogenase subunit 5 [Watersipora subtorquata]